jgi:hypothetical protein
VRCPLVVRKWTHWLCQRSDGIVRLLAIAVSKSPISPWWKERIKKFRTQVTPRHLLLLVFIENVETNDSSRCCTHAYEKCQHHALEYSIREDGNK